MKLYKNLLILLFLIGITAPSFAAVSDTGIASCSVFSESEADKKEGKEEEEEPDCE